MGLFDTIRVEWPVPGIDGFQPFDDQTKELECNLGEYHIDIDGKLWNYDTEDRANPRWELYNFTGSIHLTYDVNRDVVLWIVDGKVRDAVVKIGAST